MQYYNGYRFRGTVFGRYSFRGCLEAAQKKPQAVLHQNCSPFNIRCGFYFFDRFNAPFYLLVFYLICSFFLSFIFHLIFSSTTMILHEELKKYFLVGLKGLTICYKNDFAILPSKVDNQTSLKCKSINMCACDTSFLKKRLFGVLVILAEIIHGLNSPRSTKVFSPSRVCH